MFRKLACLSFLIFSISNNAFAWGAKGHELVGQIADGLLTNNAKSHLSQIVGFTLEQSGPWLDCVKSVQHKADGTFGLFDDPGHSSYLHPQCEPFFQNAPQERARMEDYVARNWDTCVYRGGTHGCHETYHFADVSPLHSAYKLGLVGTSDHDIVSAINAAIAKLKGETYSGPVNIKDEKEAVFLLAHLVGDLHQPLHVGSVYLNRKGKEIDPDAGTYDEATATNGGNFLIDGSRSLHSEWDAIPKYNRNELVEMNATAKALSPATDPIGYWAADWATDTLQQSAKIYALMRFEPVADDKWPVTFPDKSEYLKQQSLAKKRQLAYAGAHLAEIFNTLWP